MLMTQMQYFKCLIDTQKALTKYETRAGIFYALCILFNYCSDEAHTAVFAGDEIREELQGYVDRYMDKSKRTFVDLGQLFSSAAISV